MKRPRMQWTMRRMMAVVALAAVAVWAGMHQADWRESFHQWRVNRPIWRQLDRKVILRYPQGVTFREILKEIKRQTADASSPGGLKIYIDPEGLQDAGLTLSSTLKIDARDVPVKDALNSLLGPMRLGLRLHDGNLCVTGLGEIGESSKVD